MLSLGTMPEDAPAPPIDSVLFICARNVCRSVAAEAVFRYLADNAGLKAGVDSAGTHATSGCPPDPNLCTAARRRGYDLSGLRSRPFAADDLERFDLVLAVDRGSLRFVQTAREKAGSARVGLLTDYSSTFDVGEVAFPESLRGYDQLLDQVEDACLGLLKNLREG